MSRPLHPVQRPRRHSASWRRVRRAAGAVLALWFLAGGPPPLAAQTGGCDEEFMGRVQTAYQSIESFAGRFTQIDRLPTGEAVSAEGTLSYRKPGRMRWSYEPPHEQLVVTDGETVWLFDPLLDNVTIQALAAITPGTPLAFLLGVGDLTTDFRCRALTRPPPADGASYLELVPREEIPTVAFLQIGAAADTAALRTLLIVDTQGGTREVQLRDLRRGVSFPDDHFTFAVTDDMEVIQD